MGMSIRTMLGGIALTGMMLSGAMADDFEAELKKLQSDYEAAESDFYRPFREAKSDEERAKIPFDASKQPVHAFLPKFVDLAKRAGTTDTGLEAHVWIIVNGGGDVPGTTAMIASIRAVLDGWIESPRMEQVATQLQYAGSNLPDQGKSALRKIIEKSPHKKVRAAAMMSLSAVLADGGNAKEKDEARTLCVTLKEQYADTPYGERAAACLFEMENLQIGREAPDFEATDSEGKKFKLSEYRGKVVVLDFWGFW